MKIHSIKLLNFRSFYGEHNIDLSIGEGRSVTVIIGENGHGKTNLLNAVFWTFTGDFTPRFKNPKRLINDDALKAMNSECFVEIYFEHNEKKYIVKRTANITNKSWVELWAKDSNGLLEASLIEEAAQNFLNSILPKHLANWFIFDGEAVGEIDLTGSRELKDSLYQTFGFEKLSKVLDILNSLVKEYSRDINKNIKNEKLTELNELIDREDDSIRKHSEELRTIDLELDSRTKAEEELSKRLAQLDKSSGLERRRGVTERLIKEQKLLLIEDEAKRQVLLRKSAPCVLLEPQLQKLLFEFQNVAESQDIPAPHNEILVKRILNDQMCICDRPVLPGTKEEQTIKALTETASTQAMTFRLQQLNTSAHSFKGIGSAYSRLSSEVNARIAQLESVIDEQVRVKKEIEKELDGIDEEEVAKTREDRRAIMDRISTLNQRKGTLQSMQRQSRESKQRAEVQRDALISQLGKNDTLTKEMEKIERLCRYGRARFEHQEREVLSKLSSEISMAAERFLSKNYRLEVKPETYQIVTRDIEGGERILTTGETQTITFAFVAAIVGMASSNTKFSNIDWISEPITAPLVLDAPFSVQDELYRTKTAINIAEHSTQCVLMFDADKWRGELAQELTQRLGKFYVLVSRARGPIKDVIKTLKITGRTIRLNEYQCQRDESEIVEVELNA